MKICISRTNANSKTCYVCKRIEESKDDFTKKRLKRVKIVKEYNYNFFGLLGLFQAIIVLANKDRGTSIRKTIMNYGQTKYSQDSKLPGTLYYLGLHRPTIKGLLWTNMTSE